MFYFVLVGKFISVCFPLTKKLCKTLMFPEKYFKNYKNLLNCLALLRVEVFKNKNKNIALKNQNAKVPRCITWQ